jgi:hypothetical protein
MRRSFFNLIEWLLLNLILPFFFKNFNNYLLALFVEEEEESNINDDFKFKS